MDELIAEKIMDSGINDRKIEYFSVMELINNYLTNDFIKSWISIPNNFIGFSASVATTFETICDIPLEKMEESLHLFESAFEGVDVSKIKLGLARRRMVKFFFDNYEKLSVMDTNKLLDELSMEL